MTGRGCAPGAIGVSSAGQARRRWALIVLASAAFGLPAAAVQAGDQAAAGAKPKEPPAITLEIPHPALVIDRITSPRIQHSLELLPQYRKFRDGPQFHQ